MQKSRCDEIKLAFSGGHCNTNKKLHVYVFLHPPETRRLLHCIYFSRYKKQDNKSTPLHAVT